MSCCPNVSNGADVSNGAAIAAPAVWVSPPMVVVTVLYSVKIVASFYLVQDEHIKRGVAGAYIWFVSHFLRYVSAKN